MKLHRLGRDRPGADPASVLWRVLRRPWLLVASAGLALALIGAAWIFPQLPGQYLSDPAGAARWFLVTSGEYGVLGELYRGAGLFDVLHSFLLRSLLILIGLLLLVHLADLVDAALCLRRLPDLLGREGAAPGDPLSIPGSAPLSRSRQVLSMAPDQALPMVREWWQVRLGRCRQASIPLAAEAGHEVRMLALAYPWAAYLRPFLLVGLLLALLVFWLNIMWGWEVSPPPLAPGETYHYGPRDLTLRYQLDGEEAAPALAVRLDKAAGTLVMDRQDYLRLAGIGVWAEPGPPGLLISTMDGRKLLVRPGQSDATDQIGLLFPAPASEESLLLPDAGAGLRLVRLGGDDPSFLVEVYRSGSAQPVQRLELHQDQTAAIPLRSGDLSLHFARLPGLAVRVRHMPGDWLLWPALVLALAGAAGFVRRPRFVLAQLAPWPEERTVLVLQSDRPLPAPDWEG